MKTTKQLHEEIDAEFQKAKEKHLNCPDANDTHMTMYRAGIYHGLSIARQLSFTVVHGDEK